SVEILHDDIGRAVGQPSLLMDLDDARVGDAVYSPRLVEEAADDIGLVRKVAMQHLDGDAALDGLVDGFVDSTHPTLANLAKDAVGADLAWSHGGHQCITAKRLGASQVLRSKEAFLLDSCHARDLRSVLDVSKANRNVRQILALLRLHL